MSEIRIRGVDDDIVEGLKKVAEDNGRSLESELRLRLYDVARAKLADFPTSTDWRQAGFDELFELVPGRQYIAKAASGQAFRVTLMESKLGHPIRWQTEIEESLGDGSMYWRRATDVPQRLNGDTPVVAMRDCIRWLSEYAGVDAISRLRHEAEALQSFPKLYQQVVNDLAKALRDSTQEIRERSVVNFRTTSYEIYLNLINNSIAVMVYRLGETWSVTNGKATLVDLNDSAVQNIIESLEKINVLQTAMISKKTPRSQRQIQ